MMPSNNSKGRIAERREDAERRQAEYDALSDDDKLARVLARGASLNEVRKIKGVEE